MLSFRLFSFVNPLLSKPVENGMKRKMNSLDDFKGAVRKVHNGYPPYQQFNIAT